VLARPALLPWALEARLAATLGYGNALAFEAFVLRAAVAPLVLAALLLPGFAAAPDAKVFFCVVVCRVSCARPARAKLSLRARSSQRLDTHTP
jgi:hypothetical protein